MSVEKIKKAVIREDLLSITGNYKEAIILNQFIYWSERVNDADKFIEVENEIARKNGEEEREPLYGWIYKTAEELADEIMLGLSASQIRKYIANLVDYGYIQKRNNPKYKWDRTLQYKVNLVNIAKALKANGYPLSDYKIDVPEYNAESNAHQCAINKNKMSDQTVAGDEAIPEITTDIINNRDYNTENINKASTKVEVQYNKVAKPCNVTIPYNYTQEQFEVFIESKVQKLINQISQGEGSDSIKKISDIISYFYKKYYEVIGERHPLLSDVAYTGIIAKLLEPIDIIYENGYRLDFETYEALIDRFFMTDYGERSGNYTDYRIGYFFSDRVLENLYYRELY